MTIDQKAHHAKTKIESWLVELDQMVTQAGSNQPHWTSHERLGRWSEATADELARIVNQAEADNFRRTGTTSDSDDPLFDVYRKADRYSAFLKALKESIDLTPERYFKPGNPPRYVALICENGHVISSYASQLKGINLGNFCGVCGAPASDHCQSCGQQIEGVWRIEQSAEELQSRCLANYHRPDFCRECGAAYPWFERAIELALDLGRETLTEPEVIDFGNDLRAVLTQTPQAPKAVGRLRATLGKLGRQGADLLKEIIKDIASEAVKRRIFGP